MVVTSVSVARLVGGDLLVGVGRQTLGALTFTSNWLEIAAGASYFHSTSPILFVNFWSLAVEEQFYLLWPLGLVVALAVTRTTRQRVWAVAGLALASTVLMAVLYTPGEDATRVYYGTDTHLMGVMAGAAFALAWADPELRGGLRTTLWRRWRGIAVLAALVALVALAGFPLTGTVPPEDVGCDPGAEHDEEGHDRRRKVAAGQGPDVRRRHWQDERPRTIARFKR